MSANTATIRELRTDFGSVKRKLEAHGTLIIIGSRGTGLGVWDRLTPSACIVIVSTS